MGNFSEISSCTRLPVNIEVFPHLWDHVFEKNAVFPAVESMQMLAKAAWGLQARLDVKRLTHAVFGKFLLLNPKDKAIEAFVEFEKLRDGGMRAKLVTRLRLARSGMARVKEHARVCFFPGLNEPETREVPFFMGSEKDMAVSSDKVYGELIPFGPAYRNICGMVRLKRDAAVAEIRAPDLLSAAGPLGSPFVLDAAFHTACVWGQRYSGFVGFPLGFESRIVLKPTNPGGAYFAHVVPVAQRRSENVFDLWIYEPDIGIYEIVEGLRMRDVTGGRIKPPAWVLENA